MNQWSILIYYELLKNNLERAMFSFLLKRNNEKEFHQNNNLRSLRRQSNKVEIVTRRNSKFQVTQNMSHLCVGKRFLFFFFVEITSTFKHKYQLLVRKSSNSIKKRIIIIMKLHKF